MAQTLSQIKALLQAYGLKPKHRLGQNFLHSHHHLDGILKSAAIQPGDVVLEVGPGTGTLSLKLLQAGATLIAVEIDHDLKPLLTEVFAPFEQRASLLITDVLGGKHNLAETVIETLTHACQVDPATPPTFKLIANLPYNIASPLLANLVTDYLGKQAPLQLTLAVVMIQNEVADRLTAPPGGKTYGPLGILTQAMCHVTRQATLSPACFWPSPKVDSAVVRLEPRDPPLTTQPRRLSEMTHRLFHQRRKQIGAILGRNTPLPAGIDPNARPQQLTVEQLVTLAGCATTDK